MDEEVSVRPIEVNGRELEIKRDGRVIKSPVPDGFAPAMFRHIVAAIDLLYRRNGKVPDISEVMKSWEGFDIKTVRAAYSSPELQAALRIRGIELDPKMGLSHEQLLAITILQDPSDRRSVKTRLEAVGIPHAKYRAWMRNPTFSAAMNSQAEQNLGDAPQMALNRLIAAADAGEPWAVNKVLEISGRWNPQQQDVQNARAIVLTVMEVIQAELGDQPEKLERILSKVRGKMSTLTIVQSLKEL